MEEMTKRASFLVSNDEPIWDLQLFLSNPEADSEKGSKSQEEYKVELIDAKFKFVKRYMQLNLL